MLKPARSYWRDARIQPSRRTGTAGRAGSGHRCRLPKLRDQLARLDDIKYLSRAQKQSLRTRMSVQGLAADERNALILWGGSRHVLAMFDPATLRIRAILKP